MVKVGQDGDCFEVAWKIMLDAKGKDLDYVLVHAEVTGQGPVEGIKFIHAWVEIGDVVIDNSNDNNIVMRKEKYYEVGKISEDKMKRYTIEEALEWALKTGNFGPWEI